MSKVHGQWHASLSMARKHHRKFLDHVMGTTQKLANQKVQRKRKFCENGDWGRTRLQSMCGLWCPKENLQSHILLSLPCRWRVLLP